ncbi:uncharacterized protein PHALS_04742 [Plasmopara halstedii]|uniref:Uncharacterized protein n=1 Tax=Plasmopara halstedii TaxID=4781 RepID=A0A0P1AZS4_PLAHL|nr:uncharacterized protein PHALS_04742 [Plasmopara halstedii]CEG47591.1 hypothetical protein PHALS_04742 [Plasmopara halstedii]|eukprot:XP_024583960.1 hypothetical protein PHALS_04742 [Plasmopara halstedii]
MIVDAMLWATNKMDESLINPVATHLAGSVVNPAVLSFLLWDRLKNLTPQRARDLSRLVASAIANALGVLSAQRGQQLRSNTKRLRDEFVQAASSCIGRDVVLNSCAMAAKVAQAVSTPESKAATQQAFLTLQSVVDFFASDDGHRIVSSISECICSACEMAASPEASIFLAELATNLLHTLESEELRRSNSQQKEKTVKVNDRNYKDDIKNDRKMDEKHAYTYDSSYRSARIEKEVLLKMGVDSSMLVEIQRVLDVLAAEEEEKELRRREEAAYVASLLVPKPTEETAVKLDHDVQCPTPILPVWHKEPVREALRRRHIHAEALSEQRDPAERQAYEMAAVLAQRHIKHGELQPADVAACRVIAKMLVYSVASILLLMGFLLIRKLFM